MASPSPHKLKHWLVNGTLLLLLLPGFLWATWFAYRAGATPLYAATLGGLTLLAAVLVMWRGWVAIPLVLLLLTAIGSRVLPEYASDAYTSTQIRVIIGERSPISGIDVYCNGVHLGKTPLALDWAEVQKKVERWETPPRQPAIDTFGRPRSDGAFHNARYTWTPWAAYNPFTRLNKKSPTEWLARAHENSALFPLLPKIGYWWRFEKHGHSGLTRLANFGSGMSGTEGKLKIDANPNVEYPALSPHVDLLVDALRQNDYAPSERWVEHFFKYRELLFLEFHERMESEPRLRPALKAVVRAHFSLPENPTQEDCSRVVEQIVELAEERGSFQVPSMSSMALDIMGHAAAPAVTRLFKERITTRPTRRGHRSSGNWVMRFYEPCGGLLPLEYAAKRLRPGELFAPLVYQYGRHDRYFDIVASYRNEKALRLAEHYLWELQHGSHRRLEARHALDKLVDVRNPELEGAIRRAFRDLGPQNEHVVLKFIESRIGAPYVDQDMLASWVYHHAPVEERDKKRVMPRIPSPSTYRYLRRLGMLDRPFDQNAVDNVISELLSHPNPYLDDFIIDTWKWYDSPEGPGYWSRSIAKALLQNDTERVQDFVRETVQKGGEDARKMLHRLARSEVDMSRKQWLLGLVRELDSPALQATAAGILAEMDSEAARELLRQWAEADDEKVRTAAEDALEVHRQRQQKEKERMRQYEALLAGDIDPDELTPPMQAWVWNGERYVPEEKADSSEE